MTNHPNRKTLYTVLDRDGVVQARGCTVAEAAAVVMRYDGQDFELRPTFALGLELWITISSTTFLRNPVPVPRPMVWCMGSRGSRAEKKIYRKVIEESRVWSGLRVYSDAEYSAEQDAP
jgi:hypothetical protein